MAGVGRTKTGWRAFGDVSQARPAARVRPIGSPDAAVHLSVDRVQDAIPRSRQVVRVYEFRARDTVCCYDISVTPVLRARGERL